MSQPDATHLHQFIVAHYNLDELKTLCFNLGVEFDDLGGEGREGKARELVLSLQRQHLLDHLVAQLSLTRPDAYRQRFHTLPAISLAPIHVQRNPQQVFISHAHQDAAFAQRLAGDLRARGFPVWIAPDSIQIGEDWPDAIDRGLDESGVIVVALTPDALTSYWVRKETSTARLLDARSAVNFVLLDVVECEPPSAWSTHHQISFRRSYDEGLDGLLHFLKEGMLAPKSNPFINDKRQEVDGLHKVRQFLFGRPSDTTRNSTTWLSNVVRSSDRRIHRKTGIELVRIPAGPFLYGENKRKINLPEFWIGRTLVTNAQYRRFIKANPRASVPSISILSAFDIWDETRRTFPDGRADHPVGPIEWEEAQAFCDWAGLILPTEEQWEKAARGDDGREWPWGNSPPTFVRCNFNHNIGDTTKVGAYSPLGDSPYGCVDMAGNMWEWTATWYNNQNKTRALRGGSFRDSDRAIRTTQRLEGLVHLMGDPFGFRVAELRSNSDF